MMVFVIPMLYVGLAGPDTGKKSILVHLKANQGQKPHGRQATVSSFRADPYSRWWICALRAGFMLLSPLLEEQKKPFPTEP